MDHNGMPQSQTARTLAIGDIHGCLDALKTLWRDINPQPEDHIIFVGDYVDRGPDSKGVINYLIRLQDDYHISFLSGNHEEKFCLAKLNNIELEQWLDCWGGVETLESYGKGRISDVPDTHWEFIRKCLPYLETDTHIFVHANLEHDVPMSEQLPFTLIHKKFGTPLPHQSGKTMICGHTAQRSHLPNDLGHAICIDTDPGRGGYLTCLHVETGNYWQANSEGEVREATL